VADDPGLNEYLSQPLRDWLARPVARTDDPELLILASLLCTPPIVPYRLLRRMRRSLLARPGTLGIEGILCSAWFVESLAVDGFVFEPDFVHLLRTRLRAGLVGEGLDADRDGLRRLIEEETAQLSPLLRLEERMCWAYGSEADFAPIVEKILSDVVHTIVQEDRLRILTWVAGAFSRLPPEIIVGSAAWVLAQLCRSVGLPHPLVEWPADGIDEALLRAALALLPDGLIGVHRDGRTLTIGTVTVRRRTALAVPAVTPKLLTVKWNSGTSQVTRDVAAGPVRIEVGGSAVDIRDMRGRTYRLSAFTGDIAPEEIAIEEALTELDRRWRAREAMNATVVRMVESRAGLIVSFTDFPGFTAFMPASRAGLEPFSYKRLHGLVNSQIKVRVINIDRAVQRVVVERTMIRWTSGSLAVGDEFVGPVTSIVNFGIFVSFAAAAGLEDGTDGIKLDGLVHVSELSWGPQVTKGSDFPVRIGDMVRVRVIGIDADRERVSLSLKQTMPDPFTVVTRSFRVGDRVAVAVQKTVPFGWFVGFPEGWDGLLHVSEAPEGSTFEEGNQLSVWILALDIERRRISVTLRPPPW
jgi:predicted RNA-binding protein with RPS1 domain